MSEKQNESKMKFSKKKRMSVSDEYCNALSERVFSLLKAKGDTGAAVAKQVGISKSAISNLCSTGKASLATVIALSKYLGVSLDYLCGLSDAESPIVEALDILESQIGLSKEYTTDGAAFFTIKASAAMGEYLKALNESDLPPKVKDFYVNDAREALIAEIMDKEKQEVRNTRQYYLIDGKTIAPDFEKALDDYLRQ